MRFFLILCVIGTVCILICVYVQRREGKYTSITTYLKTMTTEIEHL